MEEDFSVLQLVAFGNHRTLVGMRHAPWWIRLRSGYLAGRSQGGAHTGCAESSSAHLLTEAHVCGAGSKGWSALAGADARRGAFVCLYAGEVISTPEAARRLADYDRAARAQPAAPGHALLVRPHNANDQET